MSFKHERNKIMRENEWKPDRWFIVTRPISLPGGYNLVPQNEYQVQGFDRICSNAGATLRIGSAERGLLEPDIIWLDAAISPDVARLIIQYPTAALVRGLVRAELGIAPPRDQTPTTAKGWFEFVKSTPLPAPPTKTKERTIAVRVEAEDRFMVIAIGAAWITSTEQFLCQKTCSEKEIRMRSKIGFVIISKVIWTGIMERKIAPIRIRMVRMG